MKNIKTNKTYKTETAVAVAKPSIFRNLEAYLAVLVLAIGSLRALQLQSDNTNAILFVGAVAVYFCLRTVLKSFK